MTVRVDWRTSLSLVGTVLSYLALPLVIPLLIAVHDGVDVLPFLATILLTVVVGKALERLGGDERDMGAREAFLMVSLTWLSVGLVGAVPFVLAGQGSIALPSNAFFESMSGITTTGATVLVDFDRHSRAVLLWRQVIQWLGGLGILVLATAILSELSVGGAQLMETETRTRTVHKLTPRMSETARLIGGIYLGLTVLQMAVLYGLHLLGLAPNMTLFDAVAHPLTAVSTSGFSPQPDSIAAFSPAVQWSVIPFMAVGATNFILLYAVINGDFDRLRGSDEFRFYLGVLAFFGAGVTALLFVEPQFTGTAEETVRHGLFQVVSIVTTTGYASTDFDLWSPSAKNLLFICMFIGGMAGSTTCSIKTLRWLVVLKAFRRDLFTAAHPEAVRPVRLSDEIVDEGTISDVYAYTLVSILFFIGGTILVVMDSSRAGLEVTEFEAMGAAASTFFNIGPAFGIAGPFASYEPFPSSTKVAMGLLMWIGRIEIVPVLVLLTPSYWRG